MMRQRKGTLLQVYRKKPKAIYHRGYNPRESIKVREEKDAELPGRGNIFALGKRCSKVCPWKKETIPVIRNYKKNPDHLAVVSSLNQGTEDSENKGQQAQSALCILGFNQPWVKSWESEVGKPQLRMQKYCFIPQLVESAYVKPKNGKNPLCS